MKRSKRFWLKVAGLLAALLVLLPAGWVLLFFTHLAKIEPQPEQGFHWPYYLYVPGDVENAGEAGKTVRIMVIPNNTGRTANDQSVHQRAALRNTVEGALAFATLDVAILVPAFPRPPGLVYTHSLDRDSLTVEEPKLKRIDRQLLHMIDDALAKLDTKGWNVDDKVFMFGFSASAGFVNRFTALHPGRVRAVAAGGANGWPIAPLEEWEGTRLRYPVGVADLKQLTGHKFDAETYATVPQFIFIGSEDANDAVKWREAYDEPDRAVVEVLFGTEPVQRWPVAENIHKAAGTNAQFRIYPGIGHRPPIEDFGEILDFYRQATPPAIK